ncbi:MAG: CPBP family intramembrane glutamic endopeptidase [Pseudomonadota bacterium]
MNWIGADFQAGLSHALYRPFNPSGLWTTIAIFVGLFVLNQIILVPAFGIGILALSSGTLQDDSGWLRALLLAILPASLVTAWIGWIFARRRGADPRDVLALRLPDLGILGWALVVAGFFVAISVLFFLLATVFGFDLQSSGMVEQGTMRFGHDPLFFLIAGGLVIGAPLAEEIIFRGQIFSALSQTPLGLSGASLITSALWAGIHWPTQELYVVGLLFLMGLLLCWLLVRFGSLWVTIACHAAWNAMSAYALYTMAPQ